MSHLAPVRFAPLVLAVSAAFAPQAQAATQAVQFNVLNASATLPTAFLAGDVLQLDTLVLGQTGALLQTINFTLGANVSSLGGQAAWEIDTAAGVGPRLIGVNIDIFNNSTNALVVSDAFAGTLGGFAVSTFSGAIGPGTYRMVVTGTGVRDSVLDATLTFASVVPEPGTYGLMLAGAGLVGLLTRRRRRA